MPQSSSSLTSSSAVSASERCKLQSLVSCRESGGTSQIQPQKQALVIRVANLDEKEEEGEYDEETLVGGDEQENERYISFLDQSYDGGDRSKRSMSERQCSNVAAVDKINSGSPYMSPQLDIST